MSLKDRIILKILARKIKPDLEKIAEILLKEENRGHQVIIHTKYINFFSAYPQKLK